MSSEAEKSKPELGVSAYGEQPAASGNGSFDSDALFLKDQLGYEPEKDLARNRSLLTLLFQSLAIAAIPYGEGAPLISAIYGGGNLSIFLGWIVVCVLNECIALSLAELASRWPTSAGPHYWSYQLAKTNKTLAAYTTGWVWLIGNITITLSVNFGFASLISACVTLYHPDFAASAWVLLLIFYGLCIATFIICAFVNRILPHVDTLCAAFTALTIFITLIALSVKAEAGRLSAADALGAYTTAYSGWGGFTFFIGLLPAAYTFSAIGMITSMAEECHNAAVQLPRAMALCIPVGCIAGLFFIIPICVTLPPIEDIIDNAGSQALPYIYYRVMGTPGGGVGLTALVLVVTLFCSISITVAASRCTWAFARDDAIPGSKFWSRIHPKLGVPLESLALVTIVQMLLGLISLGSTAAFDAFTSVGVVALALSYGVPIAISLIDGREQVCKATGFRLPSAVGWAANVISVAWILFELVLFDMPTTLPTTQTAMNYASPVLVGLGTIALVWYYVHAKVNYKGPPEEDLNGTDGGAPPSAGGTSVSEKPAAVEESKTPAAAAGTTTATEA